MEKSNKKWNLKKWICLSGILLEYLPLLCLLFPVFAVRTEGQEKVDYYGLVEFLQKCGTGNAVFFYITYGVFLALAIVSTVCFAKAIACDSDIGDTEDKNYVFGYVFLVLANTVVGITMFGMGCHIPMAVALLYIAIGLGLLVFHFKKLSVV